MTPREFEALQREWYERLADEGFEDIERQSPLGWPVDMFSISRPAWVATCDDSLGYRAHFDRAEHRASSTLAERMCTAVPPEVLKDPAVWDGLPETARRAWVLVTSMGLRVSTAARHLRVTHGRVLRWLAHVSRRLEARGE